MKKIIKNLLVIIIIISIVIISIITYKGVKLYNETMSDVNIEIVVDNIKNNENYININGVSHEFIEYLVTVEDHRFYDHSGFDIISFARAIFINIKNRKYVTGGSTITQQLAKNLFFSFDKKLERKVAEYLVAKDIERIYEKSEILEIYINIIYFGDNYSGIKEASEGYFGISPSELTKAQSVLLVGLPQAPSIYALSNHFDNALLRSDKVLEILFENGIINSSEINEIKMELKNLR